MLIYYRYTCIYYKIRLIYLNRLMINTVMEEFPGSTRRNGTPIV